MDISDTENVEAKLTFEREAQSQGVLIHGYHIDNGIFNASKFMEDIFKKQQNISFSGAGASHQSWAVEHAIKEVVIMTKSVLMHAALRCPE